MQEECAFYGKSELFGRPIAAGDVHLRLLNLTDLHMEIRAYDYFADREAESGGLARAASFIELLRAEVPNTLLFDNGDFLQGNPMGDYAVREYTRDRSTPHPMILALNTLRLDAATVGNHEFNYGLRFLEAALADARFPVVSGNVLTRPGTSPENDETLLPPYALLPRTLMDASGTKHDMTIGVIGLVPPQIVHWDSRHLAGTLRVRDIVATAQALVPRMKQEGADLVVALSHSGIEGSRDVPGLENASIPLAALDGIDVVVTGHSHLVFPSMHFGRTDGVDPVAGHLHGKPATMAGFGGSHVGVIDLLLSRRKGAWVVSDNHVATPSVPKSGLPESETERTILAATRSAHEGTLRYIRQPVGHSRERLDSYFAMLEPATSVRFVATAQAWYIREALRGTIHADLPLLSAAAPFKMGGRGGPDHFTQVPAGAVAMRSVADLYGYPNMLRALLVDGAALRAWLEYSAGVFRRIEPDAPDQLLVDPTFPSHNFDTITGITYQIDVSVPPRFSEAGALINPQAWRIRDLRHRGRRVTPDMRFVVATNDFRASRSGAFPGADQGELILAAPDAHRDVLVRYLKETPPDRVLEPAPWSLRPIPGASVMFETCPAAGAEKDRLLALGVESQGLSDTGFLNFRKRL